MKTKKSKKKSGAKKTTTANLKVIAGGQEISITGATVKDDFLNPFIYKVTEGVGEGFEHKVKGVGLIKDSLRDSFAKLNVHLAAVDDIFKHNKIDVKNIDKMHNHALTALYEVHGFKMKGEEGAETVVLTGTKDIGSLGRIKIDTPPIQIDNLSGYLFYNELRDAIAEVRKEVKLYANGNYDAPEEMDFEGGADNQLTLGDGIEEMEKSKVH